MGLFAIKQLLKQLVLKLVQRNIIFGVEVMQPIIYFQWILTTIDETRTFIINHTDTLTETTAQRKIVGSVFGGDVTQGTITVIAKFIGV